MSSSADNEDGSFEVSFRDGLTAAEKELAHASVAAMVANAKPASAMPTARQNNAAPSLSGLQEYDIEPETELSPFVLAMPPPFDFGWAWHHGQGPKTVITNQETGRLGLHAVLGGGDATYSHVHAGFGIFLRTDRPVRPNGAARRRAQIRWETQAGGAYTHALSEGGMEFTVLEDGVFRGVEARSKLWRKRVSIDEEENYVGTMAEYWNPRKLDFSMEPGRSYTFNVGFWITCDRGFGVAGDAQCQGSLDGAVEGISIVGM